MKISAEIVMDLLPEKLSACISMLSQAGCQIQKIEFLSEQNNKARYSIFVVYSERESFIACLSLLSETPDVIIQKSRNSLEDIISQGFIEVKNSIKIENTLDYEMNIRGLSKIAIEKIKESDNPSASTGIWKNIGLITGAKTKTDKKQNLHFSSYAESEICSAVLSRFTQRNGFPLIIKYDHIEDLLKTLVALEPTFAAYFINQTDEDDNSDFYDQLQSSVTIPILSQKTDILPMYILNAVQTLSAKYKFKTKDSTIGFIGINASVLRLSQLFHDIGYFRVLGYDNNEKNMLLFERTKGLATTPEHIFQNSDIVILIKEQFTEEDIVKIRPGNILISMLDEKAPINIFFEKKVCREILCGDWFDPSLLIPGLLSGLISTGEKMINNQKIVECATLLGAQMNGVIEYPDIFSDIQSRIIDLFNKKQSANH